MVGGRYPSLHPHLHGYVCVGRQLCGPRLNQSPLCLPHPVWIKVWTESFSVHKSGGLFVNFVMQTSNINQTEAS